MAEDWTSFRSESGSYSRTEEPFTLDTLLLNPTPKNP